MAITGVTGFIGTRTAQTLLDSGVSVLGIVRPSSDNPVPQGTRLYRASLDAGELADPLDDARVVIHLAGRIRAPDFEAFRRTNVDGTRQVALAAAEAGVPLVYVSSQAAAGPATPEHPRLEEDPPEPASDYGRSKLLGERVLGEFDDLRWTILRPCSVYGPGDRAFLPLFRLARWGICPTLTGSDAAYNLVHVDDVVRAIVLVASTLADGSGADREAPGEEAGRATAVEGEIFHIGHPDPIRESELRKVLARIFDRRCRPVPVPGWLLDLVGAAGSLGQRIGLDLPLDRSRVEDLRAGGHVISVEKARDELGFEARFDVRRGFGDTARWYRRHGWI